MELIEKKSNEFEKEQHYFFERGPLVMHSFSRFIDTENLFSYICDK